MQQGAEWGFWRNDAGKGLAGARWLSGVGFVGKRFSGMGSSLTWTFGEHVLQGVVPVPLEMVGCGGDAVEACGEDNCGGGVVCRAVSGAHQAGVLPESGVAPAVVLVFDCPMSTVEGEETLWRCLCMGERGDPVGMFDGGFAGSGVLSLAGDAKHLAHVRDREQVVERGDAFDGAGVPAAVKWLLRHVGEAPLRIPFPVRRLQGLECLGSIALHGEQILGAVVGELREIQRSRGASEISIE